MEQGENLNELTEAIIGAAMTVHSVLGPGLLESAYEARLEFELSRRGFRVERQKPLPVVYQDVELDAGYRVDLLVEGQVMLEIKAVDKLTSVHEAQLLSYLRLSGCNVGLLLNFNVVRLKDGIRRLVDKFPEPLRLSAISAVEGSFLKEDE
jgi:GxxExxY protein